MHKKNKIQNIKNSISLRVYRLKIVDDSYSP